MVALSKMTTSCYSTNYLLSGIGDSAVAGDGRRSMAVRLVATAVDRLMEDVIGMTNCVGNHANVSAIYSDLVYHTQVRYHW